VVKLRRVNIFTFQRLLDRTCVNLRSNRFTPTEPGFSVHSLPAVTFDNGEDRLTSSLRESLKLNIVNWCCFCKNVELNSQIKERIIILI
jgi:hypothetical protein